MAVRSAYNVQKQRISHRHAERMEAERKAIEAFIKSKPKAAKALRDAKARIRRASEETQAASQIIQSYGLESGWNGEAYRLSDCEKFTKAGGHLLVTESKQWSFDQVMAELAAASEKEAVKILAKFGINWS